MKVNALILALAATCGVIGSPALAQEMSSDIAGEIGTASALLQARITPEQRHAVGIPDSMEGWARFEAADNPEYVRPIVSEWVKISPERDYVVKYMFGRNSLESLRGGKTYYWHVLFGPNPSKLVTSPTHTFQTLSGSLASRPIRFAVVQGVDLTSPKLAVALNQLIAAKPDYIVFNGNSVIYDLPGATATNVAELRAKWHALFAQPKFGELLGRTGTFWLKNDHDFRFAGADTTGTREPSVELGANTFREQAPVTDPRDPSSLTFRAVQATRDLALWMLEVRDYRSANSAVDGKDKSLWGPSQAEWMQRGILNSTSPFRLVIQPTAIVGPDATSDTQATAFRSERQAFLDHVKANKLNEKGLIVIVGGNAQYHSVSAEGLEEFSVGSLTTPAAGAPAAAGVKQLFSPSQATPGFALVEVVPGIAASPASEDKPAVEATPAKLTVSFINAETGAVLYTKSYDGAVKK
jgi:phosphodiesterase/alkaline phosphatase D-like protein